MKSILVSSICIFIFGSFSRVLLFAGLAAELAYLGMRGLSVGRLPLLGPHDTLVFFSASIALMALATSFSPALGKRGWFTFVSGLAAGLFALFALMFPASGMPLPQILDTLWFEAHVVLAFFAYALFAVGALLCAGFIGGRDRALLDLQFKAALAGWSFFSASMVSGGIWGYYAWGTYWLWTPKELWTSILWLFYALFLHLRLKGARWDALSAWLGIAGFVVMLFTYLGVSMLMKSSHSF
ncbi:MAG: cytochrome c biogenesis protein CcsA [Deltaproteobacteria bacterium]|nr:cytochrome c biogenesis protein CcsA [Deltaproteobacteria bacterium]